MKRIQAGMYYTILLVVIAGMTGCSQSVPDQTVRTMKALTLNGDSEFLTAGRAEWQPLQHGSVISIGDTIRTGNEGVVYVEINDGSLLGITPGTQASIVEFSSAMKDPQTLVDLSAGKVFVRVTKELGKGKFEVRTPVLTGSVVGSKMSVQYIPSLKSADVACFDGKVDTKISYEPEENMTACHLIPGVKLSASSDDEWTVKKCEHPVKVQQLEVQEFSDWEQIYIDIEYMKQTEAANFATQTKEARFTHTPTPTEVIIPTDTFTPGPSLTPSLTPRATLLPTLVYHSEPLSAAEIANQGTHSYTKKATYSGDCSGPASTTETLTIQFENGSMSIAGSLTLGKVAENTYQAENDGDSLSVILSETGFHASGSCVEWDFIRQ